MPQYKLKMNYHNKKWEIYRVYQIDQVRYRQHHGYYNSLHEAERKANQLNAIHEGLKQEQSKSKHSNLAEQIGHKILIDVKQHGLSIRQIAEKHDISYATARKIRRKVIKDSN
ncbi:hypothetical protein [Bacillus sonorensis]|uniref:hypothetical protein n=1 Tax=Bacillus sonorensis TaxID=119858 RepID=UPI000989F2D2|nr:hypothetical protein [Bacillus sonorensis]